ncbi:MAG: hypothetical protein DRO95_06625 [Candidatus Altiarchaeales archaeon]|nr:MAG: hypothetical protein DRO95_06625 [Candidatus Altiarchaeales archaeon]
MEWEEVLRQFSADFLRKREEIEGFDAGEHSFYIHDPEMQYLSVLLTGYVTDFYYMKAGEVFQLAIPLHRAILDRDPEYHIESLKVAREFGAMKDQVLLGLLFWTKHPDRRKHKRTLIELLATFPPNQIVRKFVNAKREKLVSFGGLGTFEKKLLMGVWQNWQEQGKLPYYFAKYRRYMQQIINLAHIPIEPKEFGYLSTPTEYDGNCDYLKQISRFLRTRDLSNLPERAPFELVRANIPKEGWTPAVLQKCDITGNTIVLQACSLYQAFGSEILPYVEKAVRSPTVTADKILKALIMSAIKDYRELTEELAKVYAEKVKETYKQLLLPLPEAPRICPVIDASVSMSPERLKGMFYRSISCIAPFAPLVKSLVLFSDTADYEQADLLGSWRGLLELREIAIRKYDSCTDITAGLRLALEQAEAGEINTVIIATDEQANVTTRKSKEMDLIRKLCDLGIRVIVLNPTPYPVSMVDIRDRRVIYIPAPNSEAVISALRLIQLRKELQKATAREVIQKLMTIKRKRATE